MANSSATKRKRPSEVRQKKKTICYEAFQASNGGQQATKISCGDKVTCGYKVANDEIASISCGSWGKGVSDIDCYIS